MDLDIVLSEAKDRLAWFANQPNVTFAAQCGADNFTPAILPDLWRKVRCPYETPLYREAWKRGLYSAAAWWMLDRLSDINETHSPDIAKIAERWAANNPNSEWKSTTARDNEQKGR